MRKSILLLLITVIIFAFAASVYADDLQDVKNAGKLKVAVSPEYAPFAYNDGTGNIDGLDIAILKEIARRIGVSAEFISVPFVDLKSNLDAKIVNLVAGAFSTTEPAAKDLDISKAYYKSGAEVIALRSVTKPANVSLNDFKGKKIGVQKNSSFEQWVRSNLVAAGYITDADVRTYTILPDVVDALYRREVDFAVLDQDVYNIMYENVGKYQKFYTFHNDERYTFGALRGSTLISEINNQLSAMISDGTAQRIADPYFKMDYQKVRETSSATSQQVVLLPTQASPVSLIPIATATPFVIPPANAAGTAGSPVNGATTVNAASGCTNSMGFIADVNIPDGTFVRPKQEFIKTWKIVNNGTCTWNSGYTFNNISGDITGEAIQITEEIKPWDTYEISAEFVAPDVQGQYRSTWQLRDPQGNNFGSLLYTSVIVDGPEMDYSKRKEIAIDYFYVSPNTAEEGNCTTAYWEIRNADYFEIWIDNAYYYRGSDERGSLQICDKIAAAGEHNISVWAKNEFYDKGMSVKFTTTKPYSEDSYDYNENNGNQNNGKEEFYIHE